MQSVRTLRLASLFALAVLAAGPPALAQPAQLVKDIHPNPPFGEISSEPSNFVAAGGSIFFTNRTDGELWRSDGTSAGTTLVKDILPGEGGSRPQYLTKVGNILFFSADDGSTGRELWKSDGTLAGTVLVKDISPPWFYSGSVPEELTEVGGQLYFSAHDGVAGRELWKSDGTDAGTVRVKDIVPGTANSRPRLLRDVGGTLFFFVTDAAAQVGELWKSDGTEGGTVKVHTFQPIFPSGVVGQPVAVPGKLLFFACGTTGPNPCGLWSSDGTEPGTVLLTNLVPRSMAQFSGKAYFSVNEASTGLELWTSDGTAGGTMLVKELVPGAGESTILTGFAQAGGNLFFFTVAGSTNTLWKTAGTNPGTQPVEVVPANIDVPPRGAAGVLYFMSTSYELWRSDGAAAGTEPIRSICSNPGSCSSIREIGALGSLVFFRGYASASGLEPWVSDGTFAGTGLLKDVNPEPRSSRPFALFDLNGRLLFTADDGIHGPEPWRSDGTTGGTALLEDILESSFFGSMWGGFVGLGSIALFGAGDGTNGVELWRTDGTTPGTILVKDINPTGSSSPAEFVSFQGAVYFTAADGVHRSALWRSDGTPEGTVFIQDVGTSPTVAGGITELIVANGTLFFFGATTDNQGLACSLWKSDGTTAGTTLVKTLSQPCYNEFPRYLTASGTLVFFSAWDAGGGQELWKSDGTPSGTVRVKDIWPGTGNGDPRNLVEVNGILYFSAMDGTGYELWRSDGSEPGTYLVRDIQPGLSAEGSFPLYLKNVGGTLFLTANDGIHGRELWKSDGTGNGTDLVRDIRIGPSGSSPQQLTNVAGTLVFAAADHEHGMELWKSDGTSGGTVMVQDLRPGPAPSMPLQIQDPIGRWVVSGPRLFFAADDGTTGYELWSLPVSAVTLQSKFHTLAPCRGVDTRNPAGPFGGPALAAGAARTFVLGGECGIPPTARSVSVNLTIAQPSQAGYLTLWPAGKTLPLASSINYRAGQVRANNAIVPLGIGNAVSVFAGQGSGTVHVILDVNGYFE